MTRVLHVLAPAPVGGLERVVQTLASAQREDPACDDVQVLALVGAGQPGASEFTAPLRARGVAVHVITTPVRAYVDQRRAIDAHCDVYRPEIVHTHGAHADVIAAGAGRTAGAASVSTMHGVVGGDLRNRAYEWMQRRAVRSRHAVVAVARPLATRLIAAGLPAERMHVVRNAWRATAPVRAQSEARRLLGLSPDAFVVGWVGRVSREKGLDVLLDSLPGLATFSCQVAVLGDGPARAELERRSSFGALGAKHRVSWHGHVTDAARLVTAFDVLVLSSRTEGTPMILLEAMAAHVPVIATRVGGIPDLLGDEHALLVRVEDSRAIAAAIADVRRDPAAARQRATDAHAHLQLEFDVGRWTAQYRHVYDAARRIAAR